MPKQPTSKIQALKDSQTLNPHPERLKEAMFQEHDFFDARDLLQVKYEMLRRVQIEGWPVSRAADAFGFSRPSFYSALQAYQNHGLAGLIPDRPGPREAHKLSSEVMEFVQGRLAAAPTMDSPALARHIKQQFGVSVHPRSIERALKREKKKTPEKPQWLMSTVSRYEALRVDVINGASGQAQGWVLFVRRGMRSWCEGCQQQAQQPQLSQKMMSSVAPVAAPLERTLIQVLAGMVLDLQQGVSCRV